MFYVCALVFRSLTQFALNIKFASSERVGVSSDWTICLKQLHVGLIFFSVYGPNYNSFIRFLYI